MRHTPGPWKQHCDRQGSLNIVSVSRPYVAQVFDNELIDIEQLANAKLIAAAPDLLETLNGIVALLVEQPYGYIYEIEGRARAAINKATGV